MKKQRGTTLSQERCALLSISGVEEPFWLKLQRVTSDPETKLNLPASKSGEPLTHRDN